MIEQTLLIGFAAWRLASLLVHEDGPGAVFRRLRQAAGVRPGEVQGFWAGMLSCVWCTSIWTAAALFVAWYLRWEIVGVMAASAVAILIASRMRS